MNKTKRLFLYSLLLTVLYVIWLLPGYWNLGLTVINILFLGVVWKEFGRIRKDNFLKVVWGLSLVLGLFMMIRSFWFVRILTVASMFILNSLLVTVGRNTKAKLDIGRLLRTELSLIPAVFRSWGELFSLVSRFKDSSKERTYKKIVVGVLMSIPLLLVFGTLFYNADPIFAKLIDGIKWPNIKLDEKLISNSISTLVFFGVVMAVLKNKLAFQIKNTKWLQSVTETNVAVLILEGLFLVFSFVQIKYFLATPEDLKKLQIIFSEYTREGYGQMIVASILAYLVVLRLEFSLRSQQKLGMIQSKLTKFLTWAMIGEIFIFIIAATKRNYVYQSFYGYTEIRLLGFSLSLWLVAMLSLLAYKVWKKRKADFFTRGIILVTAISILGLNVFDIDGTIVRTRPASLDSGVDYDYMSRLSDDAWEGWEKIVVEAEDSLKRDTFDEPYKYFNRMDRLVALQTRGNTIDKVMAKDNWSWGGSFNYSVMRSLNYLQANKTRIDDIVNKLRASEQQARKKQEIEFELSQKKKLDELYPVCKNNIYNRLNEYYPGKASVVGDNVLLKTGLEMGPSEQTLMFKRVGEASGGISWKWFYTDSNANKTFVRTYTIYCIR